MIARIWRGWTTLGNAQAYENLLRSEILPGIHRIKGYKGVYLLRKNLEAGAEFATVTLWESIDALKEFAGQDYEKAVVPPEARKLLSRFDERSMHYQILLEP
jgi:heme-degrading monooxygenase HmoA